MVAGHVTDENTSVRVLFATRATNVKPRQVSGHCKLNVYTMYIVEIEDLQVMTTRIIYFTRSVECVYM